MVSVVTSNNFYWNKNNKKEENQKVMTIKLDIRKDYQNRKYTKSSNALR